MATLTVTPSSLILKVGRSQQLQTIPPGGAKWSSDRPEIATVSDSGLVTAVAVGDAIITGRKGCSDAHPPVFVPVRVTAAVTVPPIDPPPIEPEPGDIVALTFNDVTFKGQNFVDLNYANLAFTFRYVGEERRYLFYQHDGWQMNSVGDLIEYRLNPAGLKNGEEDWNYNNVPELQEVRRWKGWHTRQRMLDLDMPNAAATFNGNGAWPSSFFFDEPNQRLFYTWQPQYPGGPIIWAAYSAVTLSDSEAVVKGDTSTDGRVVSDENIHGPWYFHDPNVADDWAQAACQIIPIPAERQEAMRGKYLLAGYHKANIGSKGARGIGFWSADDLPQVMPAPGATLWPDVKATLLYDTSPETGAKPVCNMKIPNVNFQAAGHTSQGTTIGAGTVDSCGPAYTPISTGVNVNDVFYQKDYGLIDCITFYMDTSTPASGGKFVPEIFNGAAWVEPSGWEAIGPLDLSGPETAFWWPQVNIPSSDPDGNGPLEYGTWIRIRRTEQGTQAGTIRAIVTSTSMKTGHEYPDRPLGQGGFEPLETGGYDPTNKFCYAYEEFAFGGAWIRTANVEGILYFFPVQTGGLWYGGAPAYIQPVGGGQPIKREYYDAVESFSNGGKSEGPRYPYAFTLSVAEVLELAAGTRERNGNGFQPKEYTQLPTQWPGLIYCGGVNNPASPYYGKPGFNVYGYGSTVQFDPKVNEVLVWFSNGSVWSNKPMLGVYGVR